MTPDDRFWFVKRLFDQIKKENDEAKKAMKSGGKGRVKKK